MRLGKYAPRNHATSTVQCSDRQQSRLRSRGIACLEVGRSQATETSLNKEEFGRSQEYRDIGVGHHVWLIHALVPGAAHPPHRRTYLSTWSL